MIGSCVIKLTEAELFFLVNCIDQNGTVDLTSDEQSALDKINKAYSHATSRTRPKPKSGGRRKAYADDY